MSHIAILSESRKSNLPNIDVAPIRTPARVKHTSKATTMPGTPVPNDDSPCIASEGLPIAVRLTDSVDPMMSSVYLSSPLETILESMWDPHRQHVSLHDLIEAYSVLSARIRAQIRVIIQANNPLPALVALEEHASTLARALSRDMWRALIDPFNDLRPTPPLSESFLTNALMTDYGIQYARDLTNLCHHALRFVSDIFAFQPLYSLFTERDIQDLLNGLLKVALATSLPTPHANKTWSLVFWTIQVQNLPLAFLVLKKAEIVTALRQSISDEKGLQAKLDSFKAIHNLLKRHCREFISPLLELLPSVLDNLSSESMECRLGASHALSGFVLAKMNMLSAADYPQELVVNTLRSFIKSQSWKQHLCQTPHLPELVVDALSVVDSPSTKAPSWAVVVLASLIVLSDASVFFHEGSIRFIIVSLRHASCHQNRAIRAAHAAVWRTLVWAFSRLSPELMVKRQEDNGKQDDPAVTRENVFKTIIQELKCGIGIALVTLLLGSSDLQASTDVSRALRVIKEMMSGRNFADPSEAVLLLNRIVSSIGTPFRPEAYADDDWHINIDPRPAFFDGTIIDACLEDLHTILSSLGDVRVARVRWLSENEFVHHWDDLIAIWIEGVERLLRDPSFTLSGELLHSWQSLLLVQAHLTQGSSHLTASSAFARQVASIVARFFVPLEDPRAQLRHVQLVQKLWGVMKNVFSSSWLSAPAEIILAAVLKRNFTLTDEDVKVAWSQLCADLISVGIPTLLHVVHIRSGHTEGLQMTRQLWMVVAKALQAPDDYVHWDDVICFLVIPVKAWLMSDSELKLWDLTFRKAISMAGAEGTKSNAVILRMLKRTDEEIAKLISFPKAVVILLSHVVPDFDTLPVDIFSLVDSTLVSAYPPSPESLTTCLEILRLVGQVISEIPVSMLIQFLTTMGDSLQLWIGDQDEVMLESEFNVIVKDIYCRALDCLGRLDPSLERLIAISPFLATAFVRVPHPAIGPIALEGFWRATYHDLPQYRPFYPDCLKACLMGFADVCGGSLGEGLSMGTETQITMSTVPDSQPLQHDNSEYQGPEPDISRGALPDTSTIYDNTPPWGPVSEQRSTLMSGEVWRQEQKMSPSAPGSSLSSRFNPHDPLTLSELQQVHEHKRLFDQSAGHQSAKRRKTDTELEIHLEQNSPRNTQRARPEGGLDPRLALVGLEPASSSPMNETQDIASMRMMSDLVEGPSSPEFPRREQSVVCIRSDPPRRSPTPSSEDYNSWEAGVSVEETRKLRHELVGSELEILESDVDDRSQSNEDSELREDIDESSVLGPFLGLNTLQKETRSQTAPGSTPLRPHRSPPTLRRYQTTTTSTRIEALQRAYSAVVNDESQIAVEDLVQATSLVNRIGRELNEQIGKRLRGTSRNRSAGADGN